MREHRLPLSYWAFVLLSVAAPPLIMVAGGEKVQPKTAALVFVALVLWRLARGSVLAWGLSLLWCSFLVLAIAAAGGAGLELSGVLFLLTSVASVAALLSPSMRTLVGLRRARGPEPYLT